MGNEASIQNCTLKGNKALNGGALSIQPIFQPDSQTEMSSTTKVTVHNCTFIDNCGRLGSAVNVVLFPTLPLGRVHQVEFSNCVFIYNTVLNTRMVYSTARVLEQCTSVKYQWLLYLLYSLKATLALPWE